MPGLTDYVFQCRKCHHRLLNLKAFYNHVRKCHPQRLPPVSKHELDYAEGKISWEDLPEDIKAPNWNSQTKRLETSGSESAAPKFECICGKMLSSRKPQLSHVMSSLHRVAAGLKVHEITCKTCSETFDSPWSYYCHAKRGTCERLYFFSLSADCKIEFDYAKGEISWEELPEDFRDPNWQGRAKQSADCSAVPSSSSMNSLTSSTTEDVPDYLEHSGDFTAASSSSAVDSYEWKDYNDEIRLPQLEDVMLSLPEPEDDIPEDWLWLLQTEQPGDCTTAPDLVP